MTELPARDEWIRSALSRHEGPLLRYACRFLKDVDQARDVVQETFLRLCREDRSRVEGHLAPWLFTVCRNLALDHLKKAHRYEELEEAAEAVSAEPLPSLVLEGQEQLREVLRMLATLPALQQEVVRLKFQEELSYQEISDVTGHSVSHVGVLIHNGLKTLRARVLEQPRSGQLRRIR